MQIIEWIRHTSLEVTGTNICYGRSDVNVSESFVEEAEKVHETIKGREYDAVYASPLSRAHKLALHCGFSPTIDPRIQERDFGAWEMKTWDEIIPTLSLPEGLDFISYATHLGMAHPPKGETLRTFIGRVRDFIEELRTTKADRIAVFCHGGVINSARFLHGKTDIEHLFVHLPEYGSVNSLEYPRDLVLPTLDDLHVD